MALNTVNLGYEYFPDPTVGRPVFNGSIFIGNPDTDPEIPLNQKQVTIRQEDGTEVEVSQPINTGGGGVPLFNNSPVQILVDGNYALKVNNRLGSQVYYLADAFNGTALTTETQIVPIVFNTLADLLTGSLPDGSTVTLASGQFVIIKGRFAISDGGYNLYEVGTGFGTADLGEIIDISGGLQLRALFPGNVVHSKQYGIASDNVTNDSTQFSRWTQLGGRFRLRLGAGTTLIDTSIPLVSNTIIEGEGARVSTIQVTGVLEVGRLLDALNVSNVTIRNVGFIGNSVSASPAVAGALSIRMSDAATQDSQSFLVEDCYFENFKQDYWIYSLNQSNTYQLRDITIARCVFISRVGNDRGPTNIGIPAMNIGFRGNVNNAIGLIVGIRVQQCYAECSHIKTFFGAWACTRSIETSANTVDNAGLNASDDTAAYAFITYSDRFVFGTPALEFNPRGVTHRDNVINNPRDCGHYLQSAMDVNVHGEKINGQTSTVFGTIPKGAIALNSCDNTYIFDNVLGGDSANALDIGITLINSLAKDSYVNVHDNRCNSGGSVTVRLSPNSNSATNRADFDFIDNAVQGVVFVNITNTSDNCHMKFKGGEIVGAASNAFQMFSSSVPTVTANFRVDLDGIRFEDIGQDAVSHGFTDIEFSVRNCTFDMGSIGRYGINIGSSQLAAIDYNHFYASSTPGAGDFCMSVPSAEYTATGNTFRDIPTNNLIDSFVAPVWVASEGAYVQSFRKTEQGLAPNQYVIYGYVYEGGTPAWVEDRRLTGN